VEEIADKLKNLVKAGTHNFVYNRNFVKETEEEEKTENDKELTDVF